MLNFDIFGFSQNRILDYAKGNSLSFQYRICVQLFFGFILGNTAHPTFTVYFCFLFNFILFILHCRRQMRQMRRFGSAQQLNKETDSSLNYDSSSPVTNRKHPQLTSTPTTKVRYVQQCEVCCGSDRNRLSSYSPSDIEERSKNVKVNISCSETKQSREIFVQTPSPLTHRNM